MEGKRRGATVPGHAFGWSQHPATPSELLIKFTGPFRKGPVSLLEVIGDSARLREIDIAVL